MEDIDEQVKLLKVHLPYHESDHVLNIAYNILAGGVRLEDIEQRRQDESFPQRAGRATDSGPDDGWRFHATLRGSGYSDRCKNASIGPGNGSGRCNPKGFLKEAFIDVDGTIAPDRRRMKGGHRTFL